MRFVAGVDPGAVIAVTNDNNNNNNNALQTLSITGIWFSSEQAEKAFLQIMITHPCNQNLVELEIGNTRFDSDRLSDHQCLFLKVCWGSPPSRDSSY